jgi:hypothetical protein
MFENYWDLIPDRAQDLESCPAKVAFASLDSKDTRGYPAYVSCLVQFAQKRHQYVSFQLIFLQLRHAIVIGLKLLYSLQRKRYFYLTKTTMTSQKFWKRQKREILT